jgi:hypothetical protein
MHEPETDAPRPPAGAASDRPVSAILLTLAASVERARVSFGDLVDAFDARAYGPLIVVFAAPNVLPVALPGISAVLGAPLILLTAQLMIGRRHPWLPQWLRRRSLARTDFERLIVRIAPGLRRIERMIRPRLLPLSGAIGSRVIGAAGLLLSIIVCMPVPFGNALPGLALVLMGVGLFDRDGLAVAAGAAVGALGLVVVSGFVYGAVLAGLHLIGGGPGL